jgi:hypothetical protein
MPKTSIAAFRARLADRAALDPLSRAYRELTRRADVRHGLARRVDWNPWSGAPEAGAGRLHFGEWVTWPPAASR